MKRLGLVMPVSVFMMLMAGVGAWLCLAPPDLALITHQSAAVQIHLMAAVVAFLIGSVLLVAPKGILPHRIMGWIWVGLMLVTALSSFFVRELNAGQFSLIHALSGWTAIAAPMLIGLARRKQIKRHRLMAYGLYFGGLVIAGLFTFIPGRLMWQVFFT